MLGQMLAMRLLVSALLWVCLESQNEDINVFYDTENAPFLHGVASADPTESGVLIWTRVSDAAVTQVEWRIWQKESVLDGQQQSSFASPLQSGTAPVSAADDNTLTVDVTSLTAGTKYHYQFVDPATGRTSVLGTTNTIDIAASSVSVAMMSCTSLWSGYFNFYRHLAQKEDVDVVLHVGDYIYPEVDDEERYRLPQGVCPVDLGMQSPGETETGFTGALDCYFADILTEYRWTYHIYHMDPDLRAARAAHPFIILFDNHDLHSASADPNEGSRKASIEWVPQRRTFSDGGNRVTKLRNYRYGNNLLDLILMDTYSYEQDQENNGLLGEGQHEWLDQVLGASTTTWRILGTAKAFMPMIANLINPFAKELIYLDEGTDNWQGQPESLTRLWDQLEASNTDQNNVWVSGDLHFCWASDVFRYDPNGLDLTSYSPWDDSVQRYGVEVMACSGTRGNVDETIGGVVPFLVPGSHPHLAGLVSKVVDWLIHWANPHFRYWNGSKHGYGIATFTEDRLDVWFYQFDILKITDHFDTKYMKMKKGRNKWE